MTTVDIITIAVVILSFMFGYRSGAVKLFGGLMGLIVGAVVARIFSSPAVNWLMENGYLDNWLTNYSNSVKSYVAGILISTLLFITSYFATKILISYLNLALRGLLLGGVNSVAGGIIASVIGVVILSVVLNILQLFDPESGLVKDNGVGNGALYRLVMNAAPTLFGVNSYYSVQENLTMFNINKT